MNRIRTTLKKQKNIEKPRNTPTNWTVRWKAAKWNARERIKTHSIQSCEPHICSGSNAQTNDYFTTNLKKY